MDQGDVSSKYDELGYRLGWTFMMTKQARLLDAPVCLVGLNPGGRHVGEGIWSCESGNAYHGEKWAGCPGKETYSPLQQQIHHLERLCGLGPDDYLAAQFIPFRSADWQRLNNSAQAIDFGCKLWKWVLGRSPAKLFLCLGSKAASNIARIISCADEEHRYPTGWKNVTIGRSTGAEGRVVVRLPHLSRFQIFGRSSDQNGEAAASLKLAIRRSN